MLTSFAPMQVLVWTWVNLLFVLEAGLTLLAFGCTWQFKTARQLLYRLACSRMAPLIAGVLAIVLRLAMLPIEPVPVPGVHDEFSYLLAADTFAHGRLANPTHPLWQHFETMQIEHVPTYASMYPPLQGLLLAAGMLTTGVPFAGICFEIGIMCAALCWGLRGWFPPGWAFAGAMLAVLRLSMFSYWAHSYWGGALAAAGGALLFGAVPRLIGRARPRDALLAAVGIAILANTRPYEGFAFSCAAGFLLLAAARRPKLRLVLPALAAVLVPVVVCMAYYNWRVFGSPTTLPYSINRATYAVARVFLFQPPLPQPHYRHQSLYDYYAVWEAAYFLHARTLSGYLEVSLSKLLAFWQFFVGPALTVPLVAAAFTWRSRRTRALLLTAAFMAAAASLTPWYMPHYSAPATVAILAWILQGLRALRGWKPGLAPAIPAVCVLMVGIRIGMALLPIPFVLTYPMTWAATWSPHLERDSIAQRLHAAGGRHLVIVRYQPKHDPFKEYIFNDADIDQSEIVWAHDMGSAANAELRRYFLSRRVWLLEPDRRPIKLTPYPAGQ